MEIVLGMYRLCDPGGSEHYTLTAAEHLQRLGHAVTIFTEETGGMAQLAQSRGLRLAVREEDLSGAVDVVYAQESITAYRLAARHPEAALVQAVHAVDYDLSVPPQLPGLVSAYVATHERVARRLRTGRAPHPHEPVALGRDMGRDVAGRRRRGLARQQPGHERARARAVEARCWKRGAC